jgi:nucleoside-diphosphate-sugar epimerase
MARSSDNPILVTGSTGFVGSHLLDDLKKSYQVVGISKSSGDYSVDLSESSSPSFLRSIGTFSYIVHLAARIGVDEAFEHPADYYRDNFMGTLHVLETARLMGNCPVLYLSSYVYGSPQYFPINEDHPISLPNPYAASKYAGEFLCAQYQTHFKLPVTILRPFNIYGPGQSDNMLIPRIIQQLLTQKSITLKSSKPERDFIYVGDVVKAVVKVIEHNKPVGVVNIASGTYYSVASVVNMLFKIHGKEVKVSYKEERRKGEIDRTVGDISKAESLLNWHPSVSLQSGLKLTYDWYRNQLEA